MQTYFRAFYLMKLPLEEETYLKYLYLLPKKLINSPKARKMEFIAGRYCAMNAAKKIGHQLSEIGQGEDRAPLWPEGLVGSISHTNSLVISAIEEKKNYRSMGIDAEEIISKERVELIEKKVLTSKDILFLEKHSLMGDLKTMTLLFSAKESLYKAIFPLVKIFFGFKEASLCSVDFKEGEFEIQLESKQKELLSHNKIYKGKFWQDSGVIITSILVNG